ncbi:MAG: signal peptidase II [Alphaproteobacteria bacterium]|nr:signal peptidase II [Alphaproteobacteria bacterium]
MKLGLLLAGLVALLDQISKWLVFEVLMQQTHVIRVTPFFNIVSAWNRGISFSMFSSNHPLTPIILSTLALIIVGCLIRWLRDVKDCWTVVALGLIIGGAVGNIIDRIRFGAVYDFLDFYVGSYHWPAFNVADSCVSIGAGMIILHALFVWYNSKVETE